MKMTMRLKKETKGCFCFDNGNGVSFYLKKTDVQDAGIDPKKGITVTVEEETDNG